jgi:hypothetical protein
MNPARDDLRSWTQRQWSATVAALVIGQVALIVVVTEREADRSLSLSAHTGLRAVEWPATVTNATRQLGVSDPLLFALPSEWGFSGEAWRMAAEPPQPRVKWSEPVPWLKGNGEWFGRMNPTAGAALLSPQHPLDRPTPAATAVNIRPLPVAQSTRLELDEQLQARGLSASPQLPAISHTNLLDATVLRVAVEPDGNLFSAVVIKTSGWEVADRNALDLVRQLKFTSQTDHIQPSNDRQWGRVLVRWQTAQHGSEPAHPTPSSGA